MKRSSSYIFSADVIRVIAIIGVVLIHTVNEIHARVDFLGGISWWAANILASASRTSIPLFIMLSGYLILQKKESFQQTFSRIIHRIGIPLVFWTVFYILWNTGKPTFAGLPTLPSRFFYGSTVHLYFFIIMIGLYMTAPFLSAYIHRFRSQSIGQLAFLFSGIGILYIFGQFMYQQCYGNSFILWIPYLGYFLSGYVIGRGKSSALLRRYALAGCIIGFGITLAGNYSNLYLLREGGSGFQSAGCLSHYFDHYVSFNVFMMSVSAYFLLFHASYKWARNEAVRSLIQSVARVAIGIYIIHIFVLDIFERILNLRIDSLNVGLMPFMAIKIVVVCTVSYGIGLWALKTPYVKQVFGVKD